MQEYIYILELSDNKYYVGKTNNIARRFQEHQEGKGSAWTRIHTNAKIIKIYEQNGEFDEQMRTLEYMKLYGIDNVRGGAYSQIKLHDETKEIIEQMIRSANDACANCGKQGHFIANCYVRGGAKHKQLKKKCAETDKDNTNLRDSNSCKVMQATDVIPKQNDSNISRENKRVEYQHKCTHCSIEFSHADPNHTHCKKCYQHAEIRVCLDCGSNFKYISKNRRSTCYKCYTA